MASGVTNSKERGRTRRASARMGVREYFRYEASVGPRSRGDGGGRLVGERLQAGSYRELPRAKDGRMRGAVLEFDLRLVKEVPRSGRRKLRFRNPADGRDILTFDEWRDDSLRRLDEANEIHDEAREDRAEAQRFFERAKALNQRSGRNFSDASALVKGANRRARETLHRVRTERSARLAAERRIAELARRN